MKTCKNCKYIKETKISDGMFISYRYKCSKHNFNLDEHEEKTSTCDDWDSENKIESIKHKINFRKILD